MSDVRTLDQMEWLQEGLYLAFLACDLFAPLNIVLERKFRVDKTIEVDAIWQTPRGGKSGAGLLVVSDDIVNRSVERRRQAMARRPGVELHWPAMLRLLDRRDPGWRE